MDERAGVFYSLYMLLDSERYAKYCVLLSQRLMFYFYRLLRGWSHRPNTYRTRLAVYAFGIPALFTRSFFEISGRFFCGKRFFFLSKISRGNELHINKRWS